MIRTIVTIGLVLVGLSVGVYVGKVYPTFFPPYLPADIEADTKQKNQPVMAQGKLEPFGGIYNVFAPQGQLVTKYQTNKAGEKIAVGVFVERDTPLVELAGQRLLDQQVKLASARVDDANKEVAAKVGQAKLHVRAAQLALREAEFKLGQIRANKDQSINEKKLANAKAKLDRLTQLAKDPDTKSLVSEQQLIDQRLEWEDAQLQLERAKNQAIKAEEAAVFAFTTAKENVTDAEKSLADAKKLEKSPPLSLKAAQKVAQIQSDLSKITAPCSGVVLDVFVKEGEAVVETPLLQIGDLRRMQCTADVNDRLVSRIDIGAAAKITSAALGDRTLRGKVVSIGRIVGATGSPLANPLAFVDKRSVKVVIEIDKDDVEHAAKFVHLTVNVTIAITPGGGTLSDDGDSQ